MKTTMWLLFATLLHCLAQVYGQASVSLSLRACPGSDVVLLNICATYGPPSGASASSDLISVSAWTWYAAGCGAGRIRSLLRFEQLKLIPACAKIVSANLSLFGAGPDPVRYDKGAFSCYPGSPYATPCSNTINVTRVGGAWTPGVVTWNTQPPTAGPVSVIPTSTSQFYYNPTVDVTALVQDMVQLEQTANGFMLALQNEQYYRSMIFFASSASDPNVRPLLRVTYDVPCTCIPCSSGPIKDTVSPSKATVFIAS